MSDDQVQAPAADAKPWWQSRTLIINAVVMALAAAEDKLNIIQPLLPVSIWQLLAFALPVINAGLRVITTTGVRL
jgi:hypothetical protein